MRLGFGSRLAVIVVISLLAIQLLAILAYFMQRGRYTDTGFRMPLPDQVAAIVELMEKSTGQTERQAVLRALNGPNQRVRITAGKAETPPPESWQQSPFVERTLKRYLNALGERRVTVLVEKQLGPLERRKWLNYASPAAIEVQVVMLTGETLLVNSTGWLSINIFGFPPGFWAGVGGVIIALVTIIIVRREAQPLRSLAQAVDSMKLDGEGGPAPDAPKSAPEIRALIAAFNRMQERIAKLLRDRMALVGGISHDLRTYATRLRLRADKIPDDGERGKAVRDIDDMIKLLDNALLAMKDGIAVQAEELVDMSEILNREVEDRQLHGSAVSLRIDGDGKPLLVLGDALALRRMVSNVTENAILYGERAAISAWLSSEDIMITVADYGPGIRPEFRKQVTEPFMRLEASRNRETGGAGLGLSIAKNAAESHGGSLKIGDADTGGALITISLPVFRFAT